MPAHLTWLGTRPAAPYVIAVLVVVALFFQLSTGHFFNEDYAVYLQQAFNLTHHSRDMGIVSLFDPSMPLAAQSPQQYPPLLPLLYALPVYFFGFDLYLFKILQLALLLAGLLVFCRAMLGWGYRPHEIAVSLLVFGLAGEIHRSVNNIGSDLPFLLFVFVALIAIDRFSKATDRVVLWGVVAGAAVFLAFDMRTVGVALVPTLVWAAWHRRPRVALIVPLVTMMVLWLVQKLLLGDAQSYSFVFHYPFFPVMANAKLYYLSMVRPFEATILGGFAAVPLLASFAFALVGVWEGIRRNRPVALFTVLYTALLIVLPDFHMGARYLIPQILVFGAFACRGAAIVKDWRFWHRRIDWLPAAVAVLVVGLFVLSPRPSFGASLPVGVETPAARQVFAFIRKQVPADAILETAKFRSFHLFTGRRTIRYWIYGKPQPFGAWLAQNHVRYAVIKTSARQGDYDYSDCPGHPLCGPARYAKAIFRNRDFTVFSIEAR